MLADGRAAQDAAALEDERFKAGTSQVGCSRQAVVTTAHDDRVVFSRHPAEYIDVPNGQPSLDKRLR